MEMDFIGSKYGGYSVPKGVLDENSIVYSFGLGEDATFDIGLSEMYGCDVYIFDPTPRSRIFYEQNIKDNNKLKYYELGLWDKDTEVRFYEPTDKTHVSHSIGNLQNTEQFFTGKVKRLKTIMEMLGHTKIDMLKLDIEGAEYEVIPDMAISMILPGIIGVEFHYRKDIVSPDGMVAILKYIGYDLVLQRENAYTFK
jgi:FkbM family methyltransferase